MPHNCREIKKIGNAGSLMEVGIDRLHPEPRIDFLGSEGPKTSQNQDFAGKGGSGSLGPILKEDPI